eukprot:scaffold647774_cov23-Prasinocladus_malaysianus.AAC.1
MSRRGSFLVSEYSDESVTKDVQQTGRPGQYEYEPLVRVTRTTVAISDLLVSMYSRLLCSYAVRGLGLGPCLGPGAWASLARV